MKNLKITVLAVLLVSSVVAFSHPVAKAKSVIEAKQELYKDFKRNLTKWSTMNAMNKNCSSAEFVVYGFVDAQSNFQITQILGENEALKDRIVLTSEVHSIEASLALREVMKYLNCIL
ncbi:MAG: hypothetical protein PF517_22310 [Salinivirgaceae bacterium]|jgi:hypothetical protein|nr:hypothetical protein [Salinivirgaceae bacterium]